MRACLSALFLLLAAAAHGQGYIVEPTVQPDFTFETCNLGSKDPAKSRLSACLSIFHSDLQFVPVAGGYEANLHITVRLLTGAGEVAASQTTSDRLHVGTLDEARSPEKYSFYYLELEAAPGEYQVDCAVTDMAAGRTSCRTLHKRLRDFSSRASALEISEIIVADQVIRDNTNTVIIRPGLYRNTISPGHEVFLYFEIFRHDTTQPLLLRQTILNRRKEKIIDQQRPLVSSRPRVQITLPVWTDLLPYGNYEIVLEASSGKLQKTAATSLRVVWDGIPQTGIHLSQAIQTALCLTEGEARQRLLAALTSPTAEQHRALAAFWQARDPSPGTVVNEEMNAFYQRVAIANERFSGSRDGWQTDRGQTLLKLGVPDEIIQYAGSDAGRPYQIWRYHRLNRTFKFVDEEGIGEFELAGSAED
ncbi:MAG: GWxTD domain-containing protein [candidate division KSB1 bacterium]|nr:GWxTD domain-containing protein [candidate division KSB1 bacterium]MDZ7275538.1 GWxTD domain-containing protein [candidate division KSB1 bacterium]MDZ7286150.1 GWxTD domain-containing protein [candidate division KSB1 bacterium]MDZ7296376.1 GWxTD domain-containing protein [candidate division KSB1 bacterium]MDZ7309342.1 GWxTD domain-containing protein [candidate division KSB1 bacterium]